MSYKHLTTVLISNNGTIFFSTHYRLISGSLNSQWTNLLFLPLTWCVDSHKQRNLVLRVGLLLPWEKSMVWKLPNARIGWPALQRSRKLISMFSIHLKIDYQSSFSIIQALLYCLNIWVKIGLNNLNLSSLLTRVDSVSRHHTARGCWEHPWGEIHTIR